MMSDPLVLRGEDALPALYKFAEGPAESWPPVIEIHPSGHVNAQHLRSLVTKLAPPEVTVTFASTN